MADAPWAYVWFHLQMKVILGLKLTKTRLWLTVGRIVSYGYSGQKYLTIFGQKSAIPVSVIT